MTSPEIARTADARAGLVALVTSGRIAVVTGLGMLLAVAVVAIPVLLTEGTRDWTIYQHASERLAAGQPLYLFQQSTAREAYYLYPPLMAAVWPVIGTPELWLALKLVALVGVASLAWLLPSSVSRAERLGAAVALYVAAVIAPPDVHDAVLGNLMLLYVGAVSWSVVVPGWAGAIPLGLVVAAAAKPAIVPYAIWMLIRRRPDALRVAVTAVVASAIVALLVGPARYVEYLQALPAMSVLLSLTTGNAGLATVSSTVAALGVIGGFAATLWSAVRLPALRGASVAIAASLLVQPTIGLNYGGLLLPAAVCLWLDDRVAGLVAFATLPAIVLVSPPLGSVVLIALALSGLGRRLGLPSAAPWRATPTPA